MQDNQPHAPRICGAKTRSGHPCQNPPVKGRERCRMHGGTQVRGLARHNTVTGRYSKHLPTRLAERYEAALSDPDLLALRDEIALTDADIARLLAQVEEEHPDEPELLKKWHTDQARIRRDIHELIENRRRLVETERKRLVDMQQMMTAEQAMVFLAAVEAIAMKWIPDRESKAGFSADVAALINR